jgi:adenosylcobyric acid synthase
MRGGLLVCGTGSDAGKSFVVTGLCRLLASRGVKVAPFKAQNMALNAAVTADSHAEIGHAQWVQALAADVEPEAAMNPVLLKPTGERTSQLIVMGRPVGMQSASDYHRSKLDLLPVVLEALADLRSRYDVVICEGAGSPAEINLLDRDIVNLPLAAAAGLPAIVVGDIDRGGVFAALHGTVDLLPAQLRTLVRGFVINRFRGDPALLGDACTELERRSGVPTLGVIPHVPGADLDAEDSLTLDRFTADDAEPVAAAGADVLDVAAIRWPRVSNAGDLDPLRLEPNVAVRWVRSPADLGRPDLVVLPGSKGTRDDLAWFRATGLADAMTRAVAGTTTAVAICAGAQMLGGGIDDPGGVEGPAGAARGLGWLPLATRFDGDKVLDRPAGGAVAGPGAGQRVSGYRIHHGRVAPVGEVAAWLVAAGGEVLGWHADGVCATTLHGLFEDDGFRAAALRSVADRSGKRWRPGGVGFAEARLARFDRIAAAIEANVDVDRLGRLIDEAGTPTSLSTTPSHLLSKHQAGWEELQS